MDRFTQMVLAAAIQAQRDSGMDVAADAERIGASIATGIGGLKSFQDCHRVLIDKGPDRVGPFSIPSLLPNMGAGWVSIVLGTRGPLSSECTACAASNMAIGTALDQIRLGRADAMFAGGGECGIAPVGIAGFSAMRALSRRNDDPERASRPFDAERDGFVMGEAAGVLVLEELGRAKKRDAKIYGELVGYGLSSDSQHITEPDPSGHHPARAMHMAMSDAGIGPEDIHYINAHGTSTPIGDASETRVIKIALGEEKAKRTPDLVYQGRHRALSRRLRGDRGDPLALRLPARHGAADDQLRVPGSRVRPRLHPERGARDAGRARAVEQLRVRRPQRLPGLQEVPRVGRPWNGGRRSTSTGR